MTSKGIPSSPPGRRSPTLASFSIAFERHRARCFVTTVLVQTSTLGRLEDLIDIRRISLEGEVDPSSDVWHAFFACHGTHYLVMIISLTRLLSALNADQETIAHLLPCKHDLHDSCLKPWVERANSCPICRATFNLVELSHTVGGPVLSTYAVQDKVQEAEIDPHMILEDELYSVEAWDPCIVCGVGDDTHELMYCDGCDKAVHVFCAGFEDSPEVWYCERCVADLEGDTAIPGAASGSRRRARPSRRAGSSQPRRRRNNDAIWARVWTEVSRRLDIDIDFPFEEETLDQRTEEQREEFRRWERRFEEANRQGAGNRLRGVAAARLQRAESPIHLDPESQEEIKAWNAFEKARESQEAPPSVRRRKRRTTASPLSPQEPDCSEHRQLKRPRLRRAPNNATTAESSHTAASRQDDRSTFLSSLLKDVENKPISASSPGASEYYTSHRSPRKGSPLNSPMTSGHATPRALSLTPPPLHGASPLAPAHPSSLPLASPTSQTFSPFSPTAFAHAADPNTYHRGRRRIGHLDDDRGNGPSHDARVSSISPFRNLSYSAKEEVQRMVKAALGPRYRDKTISKEQYTEINRDVSRKMYDLVGDAASLADQTERERFQGIADDEVSKAVLSICG
nr:phd and ring finger domain-containing protein [Quercus suber]